MKTLHPARRRLIIGIALLAMTFLSVLQEGAIGHIWARAIGYLFGQTGGAVVAVTMFLVGVALILPHDAIGRFVRWSFAGREARVTKVVHEMNRAGKKPIVVEEPEEDEELLPAERKRLDDVRTALKSLQYKSHEYEPLVSAMDPSLPFEGLVKSALKKLTEKRN